MAVRKHKQEHHLMKHQSKPVAKGVQAIHVLIEAPKVLRKDVLSLAIETIQLLKHYERVKFLRQQKIILLLRLKREMDGIKRLVHEMDVSDFPLTLEEVRNHPRFKVHEKVVEEPVPEEHHTVPRRVEHHNVVHPKPIEKKHEERDKLEDDLEALQRKLASL